MNPSLGGRKSRFEPSVVDGSLGRVATPPPRSAPQMPGMSDAGRPIAIPVMGRIAAGTPDLGHPEPEPHHRRAARNAGRRRALRARSARRLDDRGRHLRRRHRLIKKQDTAATGEIIVALVDDEEATLKRLRRRGNSVALEAANPAYETRIFPPDRVKVQGRLVGLLRKY